MHRLQERAVAPTIFLMTLLVAGCTSRVDPYHVEIARAFETGALELHIAVESAFDGFSTIYRVHLEEREQITPMRAGPVGGSGEDGNEPPSMFELVHLEWSVDGSPAGSGREVFVAFDRPGRRSIGVVASLGGSVLSSARRVIDAVPIGEFVAGEVIYLSLPHTGSLFAVPGTVVDVRGDDSADSTMSLLGEAGGASVVRAETGGFFLVTSRSGAETYETNVFVSPVPSMHVDRVDRDWYYTQFRTRTTSNCGPSIVSMGIAWALGRDVPVASVRSLIGWKGAGAVSMNELKSVLDEHGVTSRLHSIESPDVIFDLLDRGSLVGVVYDMAGISFTEEASRNLFGQYYVDSGGHYLLIKGYSLDREYFVVYDPIPSDWITNSRRYGDGRSMFGRNRYYDVDELFAALRSRRIIEIRR